MVDRNMQDFYGRLGRINRAHDSGGGFEAEGALGMSYYNARRKPARRPGILGPVVLVMMTVIAIKAAVLASIGPERYEERIAALRAGSSVEQAGAWVLQADPLTAVIAGRLRTALF